MAKKKETEYSSTPIVRATEEVVSEKYEVFMIITQNGKSFIAIDRYIMSQKSFDSVEDAKVYIDSKPYELIINAACCLMEMSNHNKQN